MAVASNALVASVERDALAEAMAEAVKVVDRKAVQPVLGNVLLSARDDGLSVTATNLDIQVAIRVPAEIEVAGSVTVEAESLHDLVKRTPAGARISLTRQGDETRLIFKSGRSRILLPTLPSDLFPEFLVFSEAGDDTFSHRITIAGALLADLFKRGRYAISSEATRYYLCGTYCHVVDGEAGPALRLVSTNANVLARFTTTSAGGLDPLMPGVIIPKHTVDVVESLAKAAGEGEVALDIGGRLIRASAGATVITSKLIDHTYPDYARVIPAGFDREAVAPTIELMKAVDRIASLAGDKARGVKLAFKANHLAITLRNPSDGTEAEDELDIDLDGEPLDIGVSARLLNETLAQSGGDTVRLRLGGPTQPIVLTDKLDQGLFVVMPMRI